MSHFQFIKNILKISYLKISSGIKNSFLSDYDSWILWVTPIFALGIIFYFLYPHSPSIAPFILLLLFFTLAFFLRGNYLSLIIIAIIIFLNGFLWTKFYTEKIIYNPQIQHNLYATAVGKVGKIKTYHNNPPSNKSRHSITLQNIKLYKVNTLENDKNYRKKLKNDKQSPKINRESATPHKKVKKYTKTIQRTYLNIPNYQEFDRELLAIDYKSWEHNWQNNQYINPPHKIIVSMRNIRNIKIGDLIQTRVYLKLPPKPSFLNSYDSKFVNYFNKIGARGYAAGNLFILESSKQNNITQYVEILRRKISNIISKQMDKKNAPIASALLVGIRDNIPKETLENIRNSGLAHILSISGLHMTLCSGIFFFSLRLLLSFNQNLTLNFNIKKIAAILAIIAGFFYLLLAGMPIPAIRAFVMTSLVFIAVIFDLRPNLFRSISFAALLILIISPEVIFSVSFQLSFAAILSLATLYEFTKKYHLGSSERSFYFRIFLYFIAIILSSLVAGIATAPFSIYHFNNYSQYGFLSNLLAIPITSFIVMPCGFLAILLMPFNIEYLALYPMQITINWIVQIAEFFSSLPLSYVSIKIISKTSFAMIVWGGLWLLLWKKSWRILGLIPIALGIYLAYKTPLPALIIDGEKSFFAINHNNQLIFSKKTKSKKSRIWTKKMGLQDHISISELDDSNRKELDMIDSKEFFNFTLKNHDILILTGRNKAMDVCQKEYDLIVNMSKKYKTPNCIKTDKIIDNRDLNNNGNYYLFLNEEENR